MENAFEVFHNTIESKKYEDTYSEILWSEWDCTSILESTNSQEPIFVLFEKYNTIVELYCDKNIFSNKVQEKFHICMQENLPSSHSRYKLVFLNNQELTPWRWRVAWSDYVIEWDGFGILKSALVSTVTNQWTLLPAHAAILSTHKWWVLVVWGHWDWKSTISYNLFNLLHNSGQKTSLLCDDWSSVDENWSMATPDPTLSINQKFLRENPSVNQYLSLHELEIVKKRKYAKKILGSTFNQDQLSEIEIKYIVWLSNNVSNMGHYIVNSSYHFPYTTNQLINAHAMKRNQLIQRKDISLIRRKHKDADIIQSSNELCEIIDKL